MMKNFDFDEGCAMLLLTFYRKNLHINQKKLVSPMPSIISMTVNEVLEDVREIFDNIPLL